MLADWLADAAELRARLGTGYAGIEDIALFIGRGPKAIWAWREVCGRAKESVG